MFFSADHLVLDNICVLLPEEGDLTCFQHSIIVFNCWGKAEASWALPGIYFHVLYWYCPLKHLFLFWSMSIPLCLPLIPRNAFSKGHPSPVLIPPLPLLATLCWDSDQCLIQLSLAKLSSNQIEINRYSQISSVKSVRDFGALSLKWNVFTKPLQS